MFAFLIFENGIGKVVRLFQQHMPEFQLSCTASGAHACRTRSNNDNTIFVRHALSIPLLPFLTTSPQTYLLSVWQAFSVSARPKKDLTLQHLTKLPMQCQCKISQPIAMRFAMGHPKGTTTEMLEAMMRKATMPFKHHPI